MIDFGAKWWPKWLRNVSKSDPEKVLCSHSSPLAKHVVPGWVWLENRYFLWRSICVSKSFKNCSKSDPEKVLCSHSTPLDISSVPEEVFSGYPKMGHFWPHFRVFFVYFRLFFTMSCLLTRPEMPLTLTPTWQTCLYTTSALWEPSGARSKMAQP